MFIAILALAMMFGGATAGVALIAGWSLVAALAIYSGSGLLSVLMIALRNHKTELQADVTAFN